MIGRNDAHVIDIAGVINDLDTPNLTILHSGVFEEASSLTPRIKNRI